MINISTPDVCSTLNLDYDKVISCVEASLLNVLPFHHHQKHGVFSFSKNSVTQRQHGFSNSILILHANENVTSYDDETNCVLIYSTGARDLFFYCVAKHLLHFPPSTEDYLKDTTGSFIHKSAQVSPHCQIGKNTIIHPNSIIYENVQIGNDCVIGPGSIIGNSGFGIVKDPEGNNMKIPHLGGVVIQDNCNIGALNTVASGTLEPTVVGRHTCTDDHVHIAHNVILGENCIITACAEISGSVKVGDGVWIGPNSSVKNGIKLGARALIGIGSNIINDVSDDSIVAGNPGKVF